MENSELISIVMPVKNTELYVTECLTSIHNQTEKNWELLVVNDNSTDNTLFILKKFALSDNRIHVFNNKGTGIIDALRLAYSKSKGTYITRMDADDIMPKHKLATLKQLLQNNGNGFIATGFVQYFADYTIGNGYRKYENWLNALTQNGNNFNEIYKECVIPSPCWMVYKVDFEKCEAFTSNRYPEDYDLAFRFYKYGLKIVPTTKILHFWRDYSHRTSRTDENYADNTFLSIKIHYFLKLEYQQNKSLVLWGAGKKGKTIAQQLIKKNVVFQWVCNNPKKIGVSIYNTLLTSEENIINNNKQQFIIAVANFDQQQQIKKRLQQLNITDYYFFC